MLVATYMIFQNNKFLEYVNKHRKLFAKEFMSRFEDYRKIDQGEKAKYVNDNLKKFQYKQI